MDRRLQNLQRFLLEQLHRELSGLQGAQLEPTSREMQCRSCQMHAAQPRNRLCPACHVPCSPGMLPVSCSALDLHSGSFGRVGAPAFG